MAGNSKTKSDLLQELNLLRKEISRLKKEKDKNRVILDQFRESQERYKNLFQHSNDSIFIHDLQGNVVDFNKKALQLFGYKKGEMLSLKIPQIHPAQALKKSKWAFNTIKQKGFVRFEIPFMKKSGEIFQAEVSSCLFKVKNKTYIQGIVRDITEKKESENKLEQEHKLLVKISDTSPVAVTVVNKSGEISFANKHAQQVLGLKKSRITQRTYNDPEWKITDYDGKPFPDKKLPFQLVKSTGKPVNDIRHAIKWPDGKQVLLSINAAPLTDEKGKFNGIVAAMEDVTWRVRSERALRESEASMRSLFRAAPIGIGMVIDRKIQTVNEEFCKMVGYKKEELLGKSARMLYPNEEEFLRVGKIKYKDIHKTGVGQIETQFKHKKGKIIDVLLSSAPIDPQDLSAGVIFTVQDITERKKVQQDLIKTKKEWEDIFQAIGHPALIMDKDHNLVHANQATAKIVKKPEKELIGKKCYEIFHSQHKPAVCCPAETLIKSGNMKTIEMEMEALGGFFLVSCTPILDEESKIKNIIHIATDISDIKKAEEKIKQSEERYRALYEGSRDGYAMVNMEGTIIEHNTAFQKLLGYSHKELLKKTYEDITPKKWHKKEERILKTQVFTRGYSDVYEKEYRKKDGTTFPIEIRTHLVRDGKKPIAMWAFVRDIRERKEIENDLKRSKEQFEALFNSASDAIFIHKPDGTMLDVNHSACALLGFSRKQLLKMTPMDIDTPEHASLVKQRIKKLFEKGQIRFETAHIRKDGSIIPVEVNSRVIDFFGQKAILSHARDIKDRKEIEQRFQKAAEISSDYIYEWDVKSDSLVWFGDIDKGLGYKPGTIPHTIRGWVDLIHPEDQKRLANAVEKHRTSTQPIYEEYRIRHHDGSWRLWIDRGSPVLDLNRQPVKWIGSCIDVTEDRNLQEALKQNEERIRTLYENISIGMYRTTPDGRILMANSALVNLLGYTSFKELEKRDLEKSGYAPEYPREKFKKEIENKGHVIGLESAWKKEDGTIIFVRENARLVRDEDGKPLYFEGTVEDITKRRETEMELLASEEKFRSFAENSFDVIFSFDLKGKITYASPAVKRVTGFEPDEIIGHSFRKFIKKSLLPRAIKIFTSLIKGEIIEDFEIDIYQKDRSLRTIEATVTPVFKGKRIAGAQGIVRDITERKKAERLIRESEERYRNLVEKAGIAILIDDNQGILTYFNQEFVKLFGYPQKEIMNKSISKIIHPEDKERVMKYHHGRVSGKRVPSRYEFRGIRKDGSVIYLEVEAVTLRQDGKVIGSRSYIWDITQRKHFEDQIKISLDEKEVMLKEIHHRVKNNMQIMSSLLRLQTRRIHDHKLNEKLERYHDRIKSMALIHERLYQSEDLGHINFADYTTDLVSYLRLSYSGDRSQIEIKTDIKDIYLDINKAIPCGLIINELISNALKHAFVGRESGEVMIRFASPEMDRFMITISDNGIGFPDDINIEDPESLGLQLVNDLVNQLKGKLNLIQKDGTTITVQF